MINDKSKSVFLKSINKKSLHQHHCNGFTLLEMVVAVSIFSIAVLVLMQIFLATAKSQQKSSAILRVQAEARYAMEVISRQIRSGYLDYDYYAGPLVLVDSDSNGISDAVANLALRDLNNDQIIFSRSNENCPVDVDNCIKMNFAGVIQNLSGKGLEIENLEFYISPITDPFIPDFDPATGSQPKVTIAMAIKSIGSRPEQIATVFLQTTVSSRYYKR